jgi:hypothetical protein
MGVISGAGAVAWAGQAPGGLTLHECDLVV